MGDIKDAGDEIARMDVTHVWAAVVGASIIGAAWVVSSADSRWFGISGFTPFVLLFVWASVRSKNRQSADREVENKIAAAVSAASAAARAETIAEERRRAAEASRVAEQIATEAIAAAEKKGAEVAAIAERSRWTPEIVRARFGLTTKDMTVSVDPKAKKCAIDIQARSVVALPFDVKVEFQRIDVSAGGKVIGQWRLGHTTVFAPGISEKKFALALDQAGAEELRQHLDEYQRVVIDAHVCALVKGEGLGGSAIEWSADMTGVACPR